MSANMNELITFPDGDSEPRFQLSKPGDDPLYMNMDLRGSLEADSLTVLIHGRTGSSESPINLAVADELDKNGLSSLSISLYDYGKHTHTRNQLDCTLNTNAMDLVELNEALRSDGKKLSVVAHSAGAIAVLLSAQLGARWDRTVFIDPSHGSAWFKPDKQPPENSLANAHGYDIIIDPEGEGYMNSLEAYLEKISLGDTTDLVRSMSGLAIISAGNNQTLLKYGQQYFDAAPEPKGLLVIPDANHNFTQPRSALGDAARASANWIAGRTLLTLSA
jgi:pimeloyl-ACP methyl ester carboxylesterase